MAETDGSKPLGENCGICKFSAPGGEPRNKAVLICRRFPKAWSPTLTPAKLPGMPPQAGRVSAFPNCISLDWCGEFRPEMEI